MARRACSVLLAGVLLASARPAEAAERYEIDASRSRIAFSVRHLLGTARGEFRKVSGTIEIDAERPERSSVNVRIQVTSLDTRIRKRDDHLLSADFFDAMRYPEISFRSRSAKRTAPSEGEIAGELTMNGVTRPVTLHVKLVAPAEISDTPPERTRWLVTTDPIARKDFGLMFGSAAETVSGIGLEVAPAIEIEATRRR